MYSGGSQLFTYSSDHLIGKRGQLIINSTNDFKNKEEFVYP